MKYITNEQEALANQIIAFCLRAKRITLEELVGKGRKKAKIEARQGASYLLHKEAGISHSLIGIFLGGYDRSTHIHSFNKVRDALDSPYDKSFDWVKKFQPIDEHEEEYLLEIMN